MFDVATFIVPPTCRSSPPLAPSSPFTDVQWSARSAPAPSRRSRGAKRFGIDFERRIGDVLEAIYGRAWRPSPVIAYRDRSGHRKLAIPDGILTLPRLLPGTLSGPSAPMVVIVEVKARHTAAVWPQLMECYLPLVQALEPSAQVRPVEVCWSYDPSVVLPGPHTLIDSLHRPAWAGALEVLRWRI